MSKQRIKKRKSKIEQTKLLGIMIKKYLIMMEEIKNIY